MLPITNAEILEKLRRLGSVNATAKALGISWQTVKYTQSGRRKVPKAFGYQRDREKLCCCCGKNEKAPGFRYLCYECWQTAECGEIYPSVRIPSDLIAGDL